MKKYLAILPALLSPLLMGAGGGCETTSPTNYQVELNLPQSVLTCVRARRIPNPGKNASRKQAAIYTAQLYYALEDCNANMDTVNKLYGKYRSEIRRING